jgi:hypothetical protein
VALAGAADVGLALEALLRLGHRNALQQEFLPRQLDLQLSFR